jgi:hypothetical protein
MYRIRGYALGLALSGGRATSPPRIGMKDEVGRKESALGESSRRRVGPRTRGRHDRLPAADGPPPEKGGRAMKDTDHPTGTSQCVMCGGRMRYTVFCSACGRSSCSWACHLQHLVQHATRPGRTASHQGGSWCDERPEPSGGQALAS